MKKSFLLFGVLFATPYCIFSQNVGIGTDAPQRKLHIHGGASVFSGLMISTDATGETTADGIHLGIQFQGDNTANRYGLLYVRENIPLYIGTNSSITHMRIMPNGNVGLGINSADQRLDMMGNIRMQGNGGKRIIFRDNDNAADMGSLGHLSDTVISIANNNPVQSSFVYFDVKNAKMGLGALPQPNDGRIVVNYNSSTGNPHITLKESALGDYGRLEFANTGAERTWHIAGQNVSGTGTTNRANDILNIWNSGWGDLMSFRGDGRIGIWTTAPATGYALSVNGKIMCEELRVQLSGSWPDYVFAEGYNLMPLRTVEAFIKNNRHLPGIPAAAQVESEGIGVGEMQKKLMEKIEELTLYIIQQQKEIDALKAKQ